MGDVHPFTTIEEQIAKLEDRGMVVSDKEMAKRFLLSNNYYRVVNGYKELFLDRGRSTRGHEIYVQGCTFEQLTTLYNFDRELRNRTLDAILVVESRLKTATVHAFCYSHRGVEDYLDQSNYRTVDQYPQGRDYQKNLGKLIHSLETAKDNRRKDYIKHYMNREHGVPLWVVSGCLTFGVMSNFYNLMTTADQIRTAQYLSEAVGKRVLQKKVSRVYETANNFRNTCAHGERLFCARFGRNKDVRYAELCQKLKLVMTDGEYEGLIINQIDQLLGLLFSDYGQ